MCAFSHLHSRPRVGSVVAIRSGWPSAEVHRSRVGAGEQQLGPLPSTGGRDVHGASRTGGARVRISGTAFASGSPVRDGGSASRVFASSLCFYLSFSPHVNVNFKRSAPGSASSVSRPLTWAYVARLLRGLHRILRFRFLWYHRSLPLPYLPRTVRRVASDDGRERSINRCIGRPI